MHSCCFLLLKWTMACRSENQSCGVWCGRHWHDKGVISVVCLQAQTAHADWLCPNLTSMLSAKRFISSTRFWTFALSSAVSWKTGRKTSYFSFNKRKTSAFRQQRDHQENSRWTVDEWRRNMTRLALLASVSLTFASSIFFPRRSIYTWTTSFPTREEGCTCRAAVTKDSIFATAASYGSSQKLHDFSTACSIRD